MNFNSTTGLPENQIRPRLEKVEQQVIIILSLMLMLTISFTFTYLIHTYYKQTFNDFKLPGFWLILSNSAILWTLFLLCKRAVGWTWDQVGMAKPVSWIRPTITATVLILVLAFISQYLQPLVFTITSPPDLKHFSIFEGNLPLVSSTLIYVWLHGAFLQELIFRSFAINSIDILLGRNKWSPIIAVFISAIAFGLIHAWQGWGGIVLTTIMGIAFGFAYLFNGRRIWPLILVHGLLDTLVLFQFYQGNY